MMLGFLAILILAPAPAPDYGPAGYALVRVRCTATDPKPGMGVRSEFEVAGVPLGREGVKGKRFPMGYGHWGFYYGGGPGGALEFVPFRVGDEAYLWVRCDRDPLTPVRETEFLKAHFVPRPEQLCFPIERMKQGDYAKVHHTPSPRELEDWVKVIWAVQGERGREPRRLLLLRAAVEPSEAASTWAIWLLGKLDDPQAADALRAAVRSGKLAVPSQAMALTVLSRWKSETDPFARLHEQVLSRWVNDHTLSEYDARDVCRYLFMTCSADDFASFLKHSVVTRKVSSPAFASAVLSWLSLVGYLGAPAATGEQLNGLLRQLKDCERQAASPELRAAVRATCDKLSQRIVRLEGRRP